jgi:hypothetical protein
MLEHPSQTIKKEGMISALQSLIKRKKNITHCTFTLGLSLSKKNRRRKGFVLFSSHCQ